MSLRSAIARRKAHEICNVYIIRVVYLTDYLVYLERGSRYYALCRARACHE